MSKNTLDVLLKFGARPNIEDADKICDILEDVRHYISKNVYLKLFYKTGKCRR
jgi:hypothetical protein